MFATGTIQIAQESVAVDENFVASTNNSRGPRLNQNINRCTPITNIIISGDFAAWGGKISVESKI